MNPLTALKLGLVARKAFGKVLPKWVPLAPADLLLGRERTDALLETATSLGTDKEALAKLTGGGGNKGTTQQTPSGPG